MCERTTSQVGTGIESANERRRKAGDDSTDAIRIPPFYITSGYRSMLVANIEAGIAGRPHPGKRSSSSAVSEAARGGGRIRPSMQPAPIRNPGELPPPVTFESSTASVARCENVVVEKTLQSAAEHIVVVAGDHMTGPGDVDQSGGRYELKQLFGALFADHV